MAEDRDATRRSREQREQREQRDQRGRAIQRFRVTVVGGPQKGVVWAEPVERCANGSHLSNDLVIDDPTVSRFHCELAIADGAIRLRDLGSTFGAATSR